MGISDCFDVRGLNGNNMRIVLQLSILIFILYGCGFKQSPDSLYRQRIVNSKQVIYRFNFAGSFVTSSDHNGFAILDSNILFSKSIIKELPCTYFADIPRASNFKMIDLHFGLQPRTQKDTLLTAFNHYAKDINSIKIEVEEYNDTYGSATGSTGLMEFEFDGIKETTDSLTFHKVTRKFGGVDFPETISFPKGNITIIDSVNNVINYISIDQLIIKRSSVYKPTKPLELVKDQAIVGMATYRFYPKVETKSTALTDYGIFKRVK